jgi:hypothetical protein
LNLIRQAQYWANGQATNYNCQLILIMSSMLPIGVWGHPNPYPLTSALLISESRTHIISIHLLTHFALGDVGPIISKRAACCCLEFGVQYDPPIHYVGVASFHALWSKSPHISLSPPSLLLLFLLFLPLSLDLSHSSPDILHLLSRPIAHHTNTDCLLLGVWGL